MNLGKSKSENFEDLNKEHKKDLHENIKVSLDRVCLDYWDDWDRWASGPVTQLIKGIRPRVYEFRKTNRQR